MPPSLVVFAVTSRSEVAEIPAASCASTFRLPAAVTAPLLGVVNSIFADAALFTILLDSTVPTAMLLAFISADAADAVSLLISDVIKDPAVAVTVTSPSELTGVSRMKAVAFAPGASPRFVLIRAFRVLNSTF